MLTCIRELRSIALEWPLTGTGLAIARRNLEKNRDPLAVLICRFRWKEEIPATWDRVRVRGDGSPLNSRVSQQTNSTVVLVDVPSQTKELMINKD